MSKKSNAPLDGAKFYMVYVPGNYAPAHRHASAAEAEAEAQRLVRLNNQPAYVLEAFLKVAPTEVPVATTPLM